MCGDENVRSGYTWGMNTPKELLGMAIRKARMARGLVQDDIADHLQVNVRQIRRWESGRNAPGGITLGRIVRYFRELADTPDLAALDAIVAEEVKASEQEEGSLSDDRARAIILIERLVTHPHKFDRWISYGYGLLDGGDDKP
jgi:transcriptional regulator with XRE-family HTH domain